MAQRAFNQTFILWSSEKKVIQKINLYFYGQILYVNSCSLSLHISIFFYICRRWYTKLDSGTFQELLKKNLVQLTFGEPCGSQRAGPCSKDHNCCNRCVRHFKSLIAEFRCMVRRSQPNLSASHDILPRVCICVRNGRHRLHEAPCVTKLYKTLFAQYSLNYMLDCHLFIGSVGKYTK